MSKTNEQGRAALKVGDRIRDNDPRMLSGRRVLTIENVECSTRYVLAKGPTGIVVRIRRDRIFCDGKARRTGFNLELPA